MGVYVHIPFCVQKCYYCDFYSLVVRNQTEFQLVASNYLSSLRRESVFYRPKLKENVFQTLYFGGGTPTLLPAADLSELVSFLIENLPFEKEIEVTVEANPLLDLADVEILASAGVNRISLGAQAFQDHLLRALGRTHRAGDVFRAAEAIRAAGITNLNLDLIFGLPRQSLKEWEETLQKAVALRPTHISCYGLILEEGTPFFHWHNLGLLKFPSDDFQARMYTMARQSLKEAGYEHYEISNFCLPGYRAKHNLLYWANRSFLGLGAGASGYLNRVRYTNLADLNKYWQSWLQGKPIFSQREKVSLNQEMDETMMMGMRLLDGVAEEEFKGRYGVSYWEVYPAEIENLSQRGLLEYKDGFLRVTERGLYLENMVSAAFLRGV
ncbi:MAG: radical SAM family heme chaperone HemW [Firmicutes bacterium]|nr:radical SAM family heme chaperone HemW [Bacillota bacterium]